MDEGLYLKAESKGFSKAFYNLSDFYKLLENSVLKKCGWSMNRGVFPEETK